MQRDSPASPGLVLLTNHGQVLLAVSENPDARIRELAERIGITERATQSIINDLEDAGYVHRTRVGRRNTYTVEATRQFQHPALRQRPIGSLIDGLLPWRPESRGDTPTGRNGSPSLTPDPNQGLDRLAQLAGWVVRAPISFVSLVSHGTETITSGVGVPDGLLGRAIPLTESICQHVIAHDGPFVVPDTTDDPRTQTSPAVTRFGVAAYAGLALRRTDGATLGSLCVADTRPRRWTNTEIRMLTSVAVAAAFQLELGIISQRHHDTALQYRTLLDSLPETLLLVFDRELRILVASGDALPRAGYPFDDIVGRTLEEVVSPSQEARVRPHYEQGLAGHRHEFTNHAGDGKTYHMQVVPLPDRDDQITAVMILGRELPSRAR